MASFLSALGRARPADDIQNFLGKQKQMAVQDLNMKGLEQDQQIKQRQMDKQIKDEQAALAPKAVEPFMRMFEGGAESPMAKMVYDMAVAEGLVDTSQGGLGTINKKTGQQIMEKISDPTFAAKLSRTRIDYWRGLYSQTAQAAAQKPDDEKLQAELQRITDGLNQSLGQDEAMSKAIAAQPKPGSLTDIEKEAFKQEGAEKAFERSVKLKSIPQTIIQQTPKVEQYINKLNDPNLDDATKSIYADLIEKEVGKKDPKNKIELTKAALAGDIESQNLLAEMTKADVASAREKGIAAAEGKIIGLQNSMDLSGTAQAVLEGRETIENVKNTFGVPIQETVRKLVLETEPDFNFVQPRAIVKSLNSSLMQQQKNRGMMGSFVKNINGQVDKLETTSRDIVNRVGVRALDIPIRELNVRFIGSGHERVFEGYMKEVSAEIAKLAQGSAASVAQLPEANRQEWEKIHDVNLSMRELLIVLNGTREMANIRLQSVQDEIDSTITNLGDVRAKSKAKEITTQEEFDALKSGEQYLENGKPFRKP